jgi:hypothetical protein
MFAWVALVALSVCAFGLLGLALGVLRLGASARSGLIAISSQIHDLKEAVRGGLNAVAEEFRITDDDEEEEDSSESTMDDEGFSIDDETDEAFIKIAGKLGDVERVCEEIARREESA